MSPKSTLSCPGSRGPNPLVAELSQLMEMAAMVRPWKHPQHDTTRACTPQGHTRGPGTPGEPRVRREGSDPQAHQANAG